MLLKAKTKVKTADIWHQYLLLLTTIYDKLDYKSLILHWTDIKRLL